MSERLSEAFLPFLVELMSGCAQAGTLQQRCLAAARINKKHLGVEINPQQLQTDILTKGSKPKATVPTAAKSPPGQSPTIVTATVKSSTVEQSEAAGTVRSTPGQQQPQVQQATSTATRVMDPPATAEPTVGVLATQEKKRRKVGSAGSSHGGGK